jgi:hypothetical protein
MSFEGSPLENYSEANILLSLRFIYLDMSIVPELVHDLIIGHPFNNRSSLIIT